MSKTLAFFGADFNFDNVKKHMEIKKIFFLYWTNVYR